MTSSTDNRGAVRDGAHTAAAPAGADELDALVRATWCDVLAVPAIDGDASFFALGGHSLLLAKVAVRLRRALGVAVPLSVLFDTPRVSQTVAELRRLLGEARPGPAGAGSEGAGPGVAFDRAAPTQVHRLLFNREMADGKTMPVSVVHELRGPLDLDALRGALDEAMARHDSLRVIFPRRADLPTYAEVLPTDAARWPFRVVSLTDLPAGERDGAARDALVEFCNAPHDLERGPLAAALVLDLGGDRWLFALSADHLVIDGISMELLLADVSRRYRARRLGTATEDGGSSFVAHAARQVAELGGAEGRRRLAYWQRVFDERGMYPPVFAPGPSLASNPLATGVSRTEAVPLPDGLLAALTDAAGRRDRTGFGYCLAAVLWAACRDAAGDLLGAVFMESGRAAPGLDGLIGNLAHETQIWCRIPAGAALESCVAEVTRQTALAADHSLPLWYVTRQYVSSPGAVQEFRPEQMRTRFRVPWLYFAYEPDRPAGLTLDGLAVLPYRTEVEVPAIRTPVVMTRLMASPDGGHQLCASFAERAYDGPAMRRLLERAVAGLVELAR